MLKSHLDAVEGHILASSSIAGNSGHTIHKGTPREAFIKGFLATHLSERVAVGTGEIIDSNSRPKESRNQIDAVIYKRDYPKLDFGGNVHAFLSESVVATIEVKSVLDEDATATSIMVARRVKQLNRSLTPIMYAGWQPPAILNYVVAYNGPAKMTTVDSWVESAHQEQAIAEPCMEPIAEQRVKFASPSLDGIFVLGKGFIYFDNSPIGLFRDEHRAEKPEANWLICDVERGSLFMLFLFLTSVTSGMSASIFNVLPYVENVKVPGNLLISWHELHPPTHSPGDDVTLG